MDQHETPASDISGSRQCDSERKSNADGRVDGITTALKYVGTDLACDRALADNHATPTDYRVVNAFVTDD